MALPSRHRELIIAVLKLLRAVWVEFWIFCKRNSHSCLQVDTVLEAITCLQVPSGSPRGVEEQDKMEGSGPEWHSPLLSF